MSFSLAARNALANRRRTLFVALAVGLSSFVLVSGSAVLQSVRIGIERGLRRGFSGDLQVFDERNPLLDLTDEPPEDFRPLEDASAIVRAVRRDPAVAGVSPRSATSALVFHRRRSSPAVLVGVDVETAREAVPDMLAAPRRLPAKGWIAPGRALAERLGAAEGSRLTVLAPQPGGMYEGDAFEAAPAFAPQGVPVLDEWICLVALDDLRGMMPEAGAVSSLIVRVADDGDPAAVAERLERRLRAEGLRVRVRRWDEMAGTLLGIVNVTAAAAGVSLAIIVVIVGLGCANAVLVAMLDRAREIGLMRALGTSRARVIATLVGEVAMLAATASAAGALSAGLVVAVLHHVGVPAMTRAMEMVFAGGRLRPSVTLAQGVTGFAVAALCGTLAAVVPAWIASGRDPVRSLAER